MIPKLNALLRTCRTSLTAKIFAISFVSIHVPLIALISVLTFGFQLDTAALITLLLTATVLGTGLCLFALWRLLQPLRKLAVAVADYQALGTPFQMNLQRQDEIGLLSRAVTGMVTHVDELMKELRHQATTDSLTGLGNRRWLGARVAEEQSRARRQDEPLSIVVFDLDRFKDINDRYGHEVGDTVLIAVGEVVRDCLRPYDLAARLGGEEFCLVLPKTREEKAIAIAERIRARLEGSIVKPLPPGRITASFGVSETQSHMGLQEMLCVADRLLYQAKNDGRNMIKAGSGDASASGKSSQSSDVKRQ